MITAIAFIPTAMAYAFIGLLFTILGFIIVYVSHKVYLTIYDSLPLSSVEQMRTSVVKEEQETQKIRDRALKEAESFVSKATTTRRAFALKHDSDIFGFKANKTALRIIVNMEPCYLAYVSFETESPNDNQRKRFIRYYDRLAAIPTGRVMQKCPQRPIQHIRGSLRTLIPMSSRKVETTKTVEEQKDA